MRHALLAASAVAVFGLLPPAVASSNCDPGQIDLLRAWPEDGAIGIPTNTHVLVTVQGSDAFLATSPDIRLLDERGAEVPTTLVFDSRSGRFPYQQRNLVLRPTQPLAPNARYEVHTSRAVNVLRTGRSADRVAPRVATLTTLPFDATSPRRRGHQFRISATGLNDDRTSPRQLWMHMRVATDEASLRAGRLVADVIEPMYSSEATFGSQGCVGNAPIAPGEHYVAEVSIVDLAMHEGPARLLTLDAR